MKKVKKINFNQFGLLVARHFEKHMCISSENIFKLVFSSLNLFAINLKMTSIIFVATFSKTHN